jgi:UDP-N-acetylmuramate dehydrogenase
MSAAAVPPGLAFGVAMDRWTTWRVGGHAQRAFTPRTVAELSDFLAAGEGVPPLVWVGHGSNLLVRDGGVRGTVIFTRHLRGLEPAGEGRVRAEAGVSAPKLARWCADRGLVGAAFLAGIPGTLGGALAMNAGAYGGEIADVLATVETIDASGGLHRWPPEAFDFSYRHAALPEGHWFIAAHLALTPDGDPEALRAQTKELLGRRSRSQPLERPNAGSVFRNPPGDHAGRLIEAAGLKGARQGDAEVSPRHANFIVNRGGATAADIETLMHRVQERVEAESGVWLEPEVRIVGEAV